MGYQTSYWLSATRNGVYASDAIKALVEENEDANMAIDEYGDCLDAVKWYDHEKELVEFSNKFPDTLFNLSGVGEENEDIWDLYVQNGQSIRIRAIVYKPKFIGFDESKYIDFASKTKEELLDLLFHIYGINNET